MSDTERVNATPQAFLGISPPMCWIACCCPPVHEPACHRTGRPGVLRANNKETERWHHPLGHLTSLCLPILLARACLVNKARFSGLRNHQQRRAARGHVDLPDPWPARRLAGAWDCITASCASELITRCGVGLAVEVYLYLFFKTTCQSKRRRMARGMISS